MEREFIHFIFWFLVGVWAFATAIIVLSRADGYPDDDSLPGMKARKEIEQKRRER